ncbi:DUF975 family protein [Fusobacterium sp.]|uniref:DUF975 family protein n=1 Tax=Fusobacterium sp. TaxID=68766 RepID=UPI0028FE8784|nr:DUF975 family protein [Fusobacterium sp.]MDU1911798.1 DUF975 family protein [Fusobacterium sp.]
MSLININSIKNQSLNTLKNNWGTGVLINICFFLISLLLEVLDYLEELVFYRVEDSIILILIFLIIFIIMNISLAYANVLSSFKCFLELAKGEKLEVKHYSFGFNNMFTAFRVGGAFCIFIFLWSLLFFIPGIIKSISYSMALFIAIEYPEISGREALKLSMKITDGYKWDIFLFSLSFIGWAILCIFTLGIGFLWFTSYVDTAYSILYLKLKENRIELFSELEREVYL